ncbi:GatB/YqeY domain-containing protein [Candidatus Daviesbacteria bacterium]|nr:GatB/YqeY domain-containing protein [Candidatus Daviesbacteria bacterium]
MEQQLKDELKKAQLKRDEIKVSTLRLLISEINNARIQKGSELEENDIIAVVKREAKKRKEAIEAYTTGGNTDAAAKEEAELKILEAYLPEEMSEEELTQIVEDVINELGAKSISDMGRVIGGVMGKVEGRADGGRVSAIVRDKLQS